MIILEYHWRYQCDGNAIEEMSHCNMMHVMMHFAPRRHTITPNVPAALRVYSPYLCLSGAIMLDSVPALAYNRKADFGL